MKDCTSQKYPNVIEHPLDRETATLVHHHTEYTSDAVDKSLTHGLREIRCEDNDQSVIIGGDLNSPVNLTVKRKHYTIHFDAELGDNGRYAVALSNNDNFEKSFKSINSVINFLDKKWEDNSLVYVGLVDTSQTIFEHDPEKRVMKGAHIVASA